MPLSSYVIRGGLEGRERLRILARVMWPGTRELLARVGVATDARCLDLGCGGGDVTLELARLAAHGTAIGYDIDDATLDLARADARRAGVDNVAFRTGDAMDVPDDPDGFDVVYMRFLLTHLADPAEALTGAVRQLAPGGVLVVEDIDFRGHFCHPPSEAFDTYVGWYSAAVRARGGDPDIGPRLPGLLSDAGLAAVDMHVVQPAGVDGEVKQVGPITLEAIADSLLDLDLVSVTALHDVVDDLYAFAESPGSVLSLPRIVQAWGRRPATAG